MSLVRGDVFARKRAQLIDNRGAAAPVLEEDEAVATIEVDDLAPSDQVAFWKGAIKDDPTNPFLYTHLGSILCSHKRYRVAAKVLKKAVVLDPKSEPAWFEFGNALNGLRDVNDAIQCFEMAVRINPYHPDAQCKLAVLYDEKDMPRRSLPHWEAYAMMDPGGLWYEYATQRIQMINEMLRPHLIISHGNSRNN